MVKRVGRFAVTGFEFARALLPVLLPIYFLMSLNCAECTHHNVFNITRKNTVSFPVSQASISFNEVHTARISESFPIETSSLHGTWDWNDLFETPIATVYQSTPVQAVQATTNVTHDVLKNVHAGFELVAPRVPRLRMKKPTVRYRRETQKEDYVPVCPKVSRVFCRRKLPYHLVLRCYRQVGNRPQRIDAKQVAKRAPATEDSVHEATDAEKDARIMEL